MRYLKIIKNTKLQLVIIAVLTILAYSNIFQNQLVLDDEAFLKNWPGITDVKKLVSGDLPNTTLGVYRPIRSLLYAFYFHFWAANPIPYHFHGLIVHLVSTILVFYIVRLILQGLSFQNKRPFIAFVAALLFGLHPIHTEAITYLSASMDTTGVMLILASFFFYLRSRRIGNLGYLSYLSYLSAALAFFTLETALILPLLIILYDFCFKRKNLKKIKPRYLFAKGKYYLGFLAFLIIYFFTRFYLIHLPLSRGHYLADSFYHTMILMPKIFVWYIWLLLVPLRLSFVHAIAPGFETYMDSFSHFDAILSKSVTDLDVLLGIFGILGLLGLGIKLYRKFPIITFGIGWFFISLLPVSYIVPVGPALSERYLYLASFGFVLIAGWLLGKLGRLGKLGVFWGLVLFLALFYGVVTYQRNADWRNPETLYLSTLKIYPQSLIASYDLAVYYSKTLDWKKAEGAYQKVLLIEPTFYEARFNLANSYYARNEIDKAAINYQKVIDINPDFLDSYVMLVNIYKKRNPELAMKFAKKGLSINPNGYKVLKILQPREKISLNFSKLHKTIGDLYIEQNRINLAYQSLGRSLIFDPSNKSAKESFAELLKNYPYLKYLQSGFALNDSFNVYVSSQGFLFKYPKNWSLIKNNAAILLKDPKDEGKTFEIKWEQKGLLTTDEYLKNQKEDLDLVNFGLAKIPNFKESYVKIWRNAKTGEQTFNLFLFSNSMVIKTVFHRQEPISDEILGSITLY